MTGPVAAVPAAPATLRQWQSNKGPSIDIRPAAPGDAAAYLQFVATLSYGARYFRYGHGAGGPDAAAVARLCALPASAGRCLLAWAGAHGTVPAHLAAVADYHFQEGGRECEMAIVVADAWRGSQVAHRLLACLTDQAGADGVSRMRARVLATNRRMADFILRNGFAPDPDRQEEGIRHLFRDLPAPGCHQK